MLRPRLEAGTEAGVSPLAPARHGAYPKCKDDETTVAFMEIVHLQGTRILQTAEGPGPPQVHVSLMEGVRSHIARTCYAVGVFRPYHQSNQ